MVDKILTWKVYFNFLVKDTIGIVIQNIYKHSSIVPPNIKSTILCKLHLSCTTQVHFIDHNGRIYTQTDGIAMGSLLGPTLSNFCMTHVENKIFNNFPKHMRNIKYIHHIFIL